MATGSSEVSNDQLLQEIKALAAEVQEMKKQVELIESNVRIIRGEVNELPTGAHWANEKSA